MSDRQQDLEQTSAEAAPLRKRSEEQARTMEPTVLSVQTPEEIQRVFHELRVHQIELEMQNEELRMAQAEIETGRARYFDLYDQAPVGYCTLSENGLILEANLTAATLLGVTRNAMVKQPVSRFILKEDQDIYYLHRKQLFDTGESQECELRLVKPDGTLVWAHLMATVSQAEDSSPACRMMFSDITKRKGIGRKLFLKDNIIKSSSCAIATCDLEGNMTYGNPFFLKLWEFNGLEDFLGRPFQNFWMLGGHDEEVMRALQSEGSWAGELKGIRKDGSLFDVQVSAAMVLDDTGHPIALTSTSIDITERKRVEEALRESEERFYLAMDAANDGLWDWNVETGRVYFSPGYWKILGYDPDSVNGALHSWQRLIHPDDRERALEVNQRCIDGQSSDFAVEYRMCTASGDWRWILGRGKAIHRDAQGRALRMVGTHVDITERKRHEQQLSTALSEKEVLLREVHHRVKNNLAAIISLMDMQRRTFEDPNGQIILTELSNRIRSMSLVHEKLYRADSLATIDFQDYIQALISHLRTTFGSPDIICLVDAPGVTIPLDLASPCGLIVNELVTNALKYAFPNGKPRSGNTVCRILVRLHRDKDTYTLTVADNGIGWPAGFDWIKTKTLGMILVRMLGQHQLGGRYVVHQEEGTSVTLTFTDRKKEEPTHG